MVEMYETGKLPLPESDLENVEKVLGVKFPAQYKEFMFKTNGGVLDGVTSFDCLDGEDSSYVGWFYEINPESESDILEANEMRKGRLPKGFVAIACDGGGNEICIDCSSGTGHGKVYFWDHEMEADETQGITPETAENVHLIADSFNHFLTSLYEESKNEPVLTDAELTINPVHEADFQALMRKKGLIK